MIEISLQDPRVTAAAQFLKESGCKKEEIAFDYMFEDTYHCKIVCNDPWGIHGKVIFSEEKYANWFILQFGVGDSTT